MDESTELNGAEPRRITVTFADDGTPDVIAGNTVRPDDLAVAARWLLDGRYIPGTALERKVTVDFDAKGTPLAVVCGANDVGCAAADAVRAGCCLAVLGELNLRAVVLQGMAAQEPSLHLPRNLRRRMALGRA